MFLSLIDMSDGADSALPVPAAPAESAVNGGGEVADPINDQDSSGEDEDEIDANVVAGEDDRDLEANETDKPPEYGGEAARRSHAAGSRPGEGGRASVLDESGSRSRARSVSADDYDMYYQDGGREISGPHSLSTLRRRAQSSAANGFHFDMLVSFDKRFTVPHLYSILFIVNTPFALDTTHPLVNPDFGRRAENS